MRMRTILLLLSFFPATVAAQTLRQAAGDHLLIGAAVMSSVIDDPLRAKLLAEQFNCLTGENEFKPGMIEPKPGLFTFTAADRLVDFAQQHQMAVIGHTLCWHQQTPKWFYQSNDGSPLPRAAALANLKSHIDAVLTHFHGKIRGWDVVNEALSAGGPQDLRDTPARRAIGDDVVERAFEFAHAADPDVELYYNDYEIELPPKRAKAIRLIRRLKSAGLRIDAVGIQGHWSLTLPDVKMIEDAIVDFHALGVKVSITELDIDVLRRTGSGADINDIQKSGADPYKTGCPESVLQQQSQRYRDIFQMLARHRDAIERVTFWGLTDRESWLNTYPVRGRTNYPLLFDRDLKPKPAFAAVRDAIEQ
jgi:endo-1,4-beta-xylanase